MKSDGWKLRIEWLNHEIFGKSDCFRFEDESIGVEVS